MQISTQQLHKLIILMIVLFFIGFLAIVQPAFLQHIRQQTPVSVTVANIKTVSKPLRIEKDGMAVHGTVIPIYSEGTGRVNAVYVAAGQSVKAGQPLIKLDITSSKDIGTSGAASDPASSVQSSSVSKDIYEKALKDYKRYQKLYEQGAIARKQLEAAQTRLQEAQAGEGPPNIAETVKKTISATGPVTIQASIDGTVTGSIATVGSTIQAGQELMELGSGQDIEIVVPLEQSELEYIPLGSLAVINAAGEQLAGQVSGIYPEVNDKKTISFKAHIKLKQSPGNLLTLGMSVSVDIATGQEVSTIAIPQQAVLHDEDGQYFVFIFIEGKAVRQRVIIGDLIGTLREITSGIPEGSLVITNHLDQLKNGDIITVTE